MTRAIGHMNDSGLRRIVLATALLVLSAPAYAMNCAPREQISMQLAAQYHETPSGAGLSGNGSLLVVYASKAGTWTLAVVSPEGLACVADGGDGWTDLRLPSGVVAQAR